MTAEHIALVSTFSGWWPLAIHAAKVTLTIEPHARAAKFP
jgi:hypothetical protein